MAVSVPSVCCEIQLVALCDSKESNIHKYVSKEGLGLWQDVIWWEYQTTTQKMISKIQKKEYYL